MKINKHNHRAFSTKTKKQGSSYKEQILNK